MNRLSLGPTWPVNNGGFEMEEELTSSIRKLQSGRASGHDETLAEFFSALLSNMQSLGYPLLDIVIMLARGVRSRQTGTLLG